MGCGAPPAREFDSLIVWDLAEKEIDRCGGPWGASGTSKVRQLDSLIGF